MNGTEARVIELLAAELAQKTVRLAQLIAANEALQRRLAELEARLKPEGGDSEKPQDEAGT